AAQAEAAAAPPPPPQQQQHYPVHPNMPQQQQYSDYELGMTAYQYNLAYRMDVELPPFSPPLLAAVERYRAQTPIPPYYPL
ncbi:hypothetical protein A2U01_0093136, partial [Trifolium medium]|nr:hypothetical protein [Trifolium medium]